jgi:RNA polymerase sigma factor (sigma-70 family)
MVTEDTMDRNREHELVMKAQAGDRDSYGKLVDLYGGAVLAIAYSRVGKHAASQDIAQDAFLLGFENLAKLKESRSFGTWLKTITRNLCNNWLKSQAYRDRLRRDSVNLRERLGRTNANGPEEDLEREETRRMVDMAMSRLPVQDREVLTLYYFEGKSVQQAARVLDISVEAMKKRLQRARKRLRSELEARVEAGLVEAGRKRKMSGRVLAAIPIGASFAKVAPVASVLPSAPLLNIASLFAKKGGIAMSIKKTSAIVALVCAALVAITGALYVAGSGRSHQKAAQPVRLQAIESAPAQSQPIEETAVEGPVEGQIEEWELVSLAANLAQDEQAAGDEHAEAVLPASVGGYVQDDKGYALEGADVHLEITEDPLWVEVLKTYKAETGADGQYMISGIDTFGNVAVYASLEGYVMQRAWRKSLRPGVEVTDVDFTLPAATYVVAGAVVSGSKVPIAGAEVQLRHYGYDEEGLQETAERGGAPGNVTGRRWAFAVTDQWGRFELGVDEQGLCDFTVTKDGYGAGFFPQVATGTHDALFVLRGYGAIAGRVTREDGVPVENAEVVATGVAVPGGLDPTEVRAQPLALPAVVVYTDTKGAYTADGLSEDYVYAVSARDTSGAEAAGVRQTDDVFAYMRNLSAAVQKNGVRIKAGQTTAGVDLVISAPQSATIFGTVTETASGRAVHPLAVRAMTIAEGGTRAELGVAHTDAEGFYKLSLALDEQSTIRILWCHVHTGGFGPPSEDAQVAVLDVGPGEKEQLDFTIEAVPFTAPIRFVDKRAKPLQGIVPGIRCIGRMGRQVATSMTSDAEGLVIWQGLTPGETYEALAYGPSGAILGRSDPFSGAPGETITEVVVICPRRGGVEGVLLCPDGDPLASTEVVCATFLVDGTVASQRAASNADGAFCVLNALPEGVYLKVFLVCQQGDDEVQLAVVENVRITADTIIDLGTIVLQPVSAEEAAEMLAGG